MAEKEIDVAQSTDVGEKHDDTAVHTHKVRLEDADDVAKFIAGNQVEFTEESSRRIRRKIDIHMLPLLYVCLDRSMKYLY